jgi:hypothetical protein
LDEVKFRYSGADIAADALRAEADLACT